MLATACAGAPQTQPATSLPAIATATLPPPPSQSPSPGASPTPAATARAGAWAIVGSTLTGADHWAAIVLGRDEVLLAGGFAPAELFDLAAGTSSPTGSRDDWPIGGVVRLADGRVLVDRNGGAQLFDPVRDSWTTTPGFGATWTLVLLQDGTVLAVGGYDGAGATRDSVIFDPGRNAWRSTGSMATARGWHSCTRLDDGRVLAVGGMDSNPEATASLKGAELYDPASQRWGLTGEMRTPRAGHTATLLADGRVLVVGGWSQRSSPLTPALTSAEIYDPRTGAWSDGGAMAVAREGHLATLLPDGRVLVAGGRSGRPSSAALESTELFDPASGSWASGPSMSVPRVFAAATLLPDGRVIVAGGTSREEQGPVEVFVLRP
jgi:hypothetical protein